MISYAIIPQLEREFAGRDIKLTENARSLTIDGVYIPINFIGENLEVFYKLSEGLQADIISKIKEVALIVLGTPAVIVEETPVVVEEAVKPVKAPEAPKVVEEEVTAPEVTPEAVEPTITE